MLVSSRKLPLRSLRCLLGPFLPLVKTYDSSWLAFKSYWEGRFEMGEEAMTCEVTFDGSLSALTLSSPTCITSEDGRRLKLNSLLFRPSYMLDY